jgi:hypothetical protein
MLRRHRLRAIQHFILFATILLCSSGPLSAGAPAYYSSDTNKVFWFIHASDVHIGTRGSADTTNLQWLVTQARAVINPNFIVVTGDLTDSTNGNWLGYPNGPYQAEWDQYKSILASNGVSASFYFDIPGNHDAYNDQYFSYYVANSIQGQATGKTQVSWTRTFSWGKYHFLGVNTADNTGAPFSLSSPYGDHAGLDSSELSFIYSDLHDNQDASLTLAFGHHPLVPTGDSADTYLYYGKDEFVGYLNSFGASLYGYGHTHVSSEQYYVQNMRDGIFYFNVAALGKDSPNQYTVTAIDCNGISSVTQTVGAWPVVLITAPMDRRLGGVVNPYAYRVPNGATNPVRALVFDPATATQVQFRIDTGAWQPMTVVPGSSILWQGVWNAAALPEGEHTIDVQATTGSGTRTDRVTTYVESQSSATPPAAPSGLAATAVSSSQINLSWTDASTNEDGFQIERCTGSTCGDFAQVATTGKDIPRYSDTGLSPSTTYSYHVRACNSAGCSGYCDSVSLATLPSAIPPAAPTGLTATAVSRSQINLSWTDASSNEDGFRIERCTGSKCTNFAQVATVGANVKTYSNTGLPTNTTYTYRVRAYNAAGSSAYSNTARATTKRR